MEKEDRRGQTRNALKLDGGKRVNVYLDAETLQRAAELGNGNVSEGIRRALSKQESME